MNLLRVSGEEGNIIYIYTHKIYIDICIVTFWFLVFVLQLSSNATETLFLTGGL